MACVTVQTEQVPKPNPPRLPSAEDVLAVRIKYERAKRGWSSEELAQRMTDIGVSLNQSAVWRIENATPRRKISLDEALGFARVFELSLDDLIGPPEAIGADLYKVMARTRRAFDEMKLSLHALIDAMAAAESVNVQDPEAVALVAELQRWIGPLPETRT